MDHDRERTARILTALAAQLERLTLNLTLAAAAVAWLLLFDAALRLCLEIAYPLLAASFITALAMFATLAAYRRCQALVAQRVGRVLLLLGPLPAPLARQAALPTAAWSGSVWSELLGRLAGAYRAACQAQGQSGYPRLHWPLALYLLPAAGLALASVKGLVLLAAAKDWPPPGSPYAIWEAVVKVLLVMAAGAMLVQRLAPLAGLIAACREHPELCGNALTTLPDGFDADAHLSYPERMQGN